MYGRRWQQRQGVDIADTTGLPYNAERRAPSAERRAPSAERRAPSAERRAPSAERRAPSAERRAPSAERRAPSAERRAPSAERRAPSAERRAPSAERRAPSAERRAPSAERRAPSAERRAPSAERRAPSAERRAPSAERRAPSAERRAPSAERRAPSAERRAPSAERRAPSAERRAPSAERRAPSAEAMIAPRPREQADPPSPPDRLPPDRLPPRRGGRPSSETAKPAGRPTGFACVCVARQGPVCSARALGAAALLALSGALALLARTGTGPGRVGSRPFVHALLVTIAMLLPPGVSQAQAQEVVLVSNMAEQSGGSLAISSAEYLYEPIAGFTFGGEERIAQQFTTGTNPGGYTLRSVVLNLRQDGGAGSVVHVAIHRDSLGLGFPGTQLAVLDTPADPFGTTSGAAGNRTFSAASALSLDARARYWVVLKALVSHIFRTTPATIGSQRGPVATAS